MLEAWKMSLDHDHRWQADHPSHLLRQGLERFGAYGCSTAGVERVFGKGRRAMGDHRKHVQDDLYEDEVFLMSDVVPSHDHADIRRAQRLYTAYFGAARSHVKLRADAGVKRKMNKVGINLLPGNPIASLR